jgi:hypothetical protein
MANHIDCKGTSGAVYRFFRPQQGRPLSPAGGVYVIGRERAEGLEILYIGETESLMTGSNSQWTEAVKRHGATDLFVRLAISAGVRRREQSDLVDAYGPPMNGGESTAH